MPDRFERWLGEARVQEAADERRRSWWLAHRPIDDTTCAQLAAALVDRGAVVVHSTSGSTHRGVLELAGDEHLRLRCTTTGAVVLVRWEGVAALRSSEHVVCRPGSRLSRSSTTTFLGELEQLVAEGARVVVGCDAPGPPWSGELTGLGADHLRVRLDDGGEACIPAGSVVEVTTRSACWPGPGGT